LKSNVKLSSQTPSFQARPHHFIEEQKTLGRKSSEIIARTDAIEAEWLEACEEMELAESGD